MIRVLRECLTAACIGDDEENPTLQLFGLADHKHESIDVPGHAFPVVVCRSARRSRCPCLALNAGNILSPRALRRRPDAWISR